VGNHKLLRDWETVRAEPREFREWAVVMSLANQERKCLLSAELEGLDAYLPRYQDVRGRERLLFRGYVLVKCSKERETTLYHLKGGYQPIAFNGALARLSGQTIIHLRARESKAGYIQFNERFEHNQALIVMEGPYKNQIVLYKGMDAQARELALFSLLGREVVRPFDHHELSALQLDA
jgi:hypothetical protein